MLTRDDPDYKSWLLDDIYSIIETSARGVHHLRIDFTLYQRGDALRQWEVSAKMVQENAQGQVLSETAKTYWSEQVEPVLDYLRDLLRDPEANVHLQIIPRTVLIVEPSPGQPCRFELNLPELSLRDFCKSVLDHNTVGDWLLEHTPRIRGRLYVIYPGGGSEIPAADPQSFVNPAHAGLPPENETPPQPAAAPKVPIKPLDPVAYDEARINANTGDIDHRLSNIYTTIMQDPHIPDLIKETEERVADPEKQLVEAQQRARQSSKSAMNQLQGIMKERLSQMQQDSDLDSQDVHDLSGHIVDTPTPESAPTANQADQPNLVNADDFMTENSIDEK